MTGRWFKLGNNGAAAAEFAMVAPLLIVFIIGVIEAGKLMWTWNRAEKATQMGARFAAVTDVIPKGLVDYNYVGVSGLTQGDVVPASAFGVMECTATACSCKTNPCPPPGDFRNEAFGAVVRRMAVFKKDIKPANVRVEYGSSGLGYAGDPNGMDISPLVTVRLTGLTYRFAFGPRLNLPDFRTTLPMEDGRGTASN